MLLSVVVACACSSGPQVSKLYSDDSYSGPGLGNLLVVGIAENYSRRAEFERHLAARLRTAGSDATAYHALAPGNDALDRDTIVAQLRSGGFDGMLLTRIVSQSTSAEIHSGRSTISSDRRDGAVFDFVRNDYASLTDPDVMAYTRSGVLVADLYASNEERRIWSVEIAASVESSVSATIEEIAEGIVDALNRDHLLAR